MNRRLLQVNEILEVIQPNAIETNLAARLGSINDGGYIVIQDFSKNDFLLSMGIADDVNFELEISSKILGIDLYDHSIQSLPREVSNGRFFKERIGKSPDVSIFSAMLRTNHDGELILKMDIEGSEWDVLHQLELHELLKFRQLVIEFHFLAISSNEEEFNLKLAVLKKLAENFYILNSHPNNCGDVYLIENLLLPDVIEITYVRKDSYSLKSENKENQKNKIELLNRPCSPEYPELYLPKPISKELLHLESKNIGEFSRLHFESMTRDRVDIVTRLIALTHERDALTHERDALTHERDALFREKEIDFLEAVALKAQILEIRESRIWRWTHLYRRIRNVRTMKKI